MKPTRQYASAAAFRAALEARLQTIAKAEGIDMQRLRRQVSFDRLLVRLFADKNAPWLLKGGYAMELRLQKARSTKDIDLTVAAGLEGGQARLLALLQDSASVMIDDDFFRFTIGASIMDLEGAPEGGARYPVTAPWPAGSSPSFTWTWGSGTKSCHRSNTSVPATGLILRVLRPRFVRPSPGNSNSPKSFMLSASPATPDPTAG